MAYNPTDQCVYVADTYNHKIKRIDVTNNTCRTCNITSDASSAADPEPAHLFNEPGGLCVSPPGDQLFVADTNNHRIVVVDLRTMIARPWQLDFNAEQQRLPKDQRTIKSPVIKSNRAIRLSGNGVARLDLQITFAAEADIKFTADASQKWAVAFATPALSAQSATSGKVDPSSGAIHVNLALDASAVEREQPQSATVSFRLNLCSSSVCFQRKFAIEIPVVVATTDVEEDAVDGDNPNRIRAVLQKDSAIVGLVYDAKW